MKATAEESTRSQASGLRGMKVKCRRELTANKTPSRHASKRTNDSPEQRHGSGDALNQSLARPVHDRCIENAKDELAVLPACASDIGAAAVEYPVVDENSLAVHERDVAAVPPSAAGKRNSGAQCL